MALDVTPVNRNLHTRVTFMSLEFEDLFVVLGLAAVMNVVSRFVGGSSSVLPAVRSAAGRCAAAHDLQVRQATRLYPGPFSLVHQTACLLRTGPGPADAEGVHQRARSR